MTRQFIKSTLVCSIMTALIACSDNDNNQIVEAKKEAPATGTQISLRLMETTDLHANVLNYNYFSDKRDDKVGLVKTATLIHQARAEVTNSILVDNGDLLQGSPLGDYMANIKKLAPGEVHPMFAAMNTLDYDVANIGNHEFNFGLDFLNEAVNDANFKYISANIFVDDQDSDASNDLPLFIPYLIEQKTFIDTKGDEQSLNVGYIGFVPPQVMQWDKANLQGKVIAKDIIAMANKYVPEMKDKGADIIIAIAHSGLNVDAHKPMAENASYHLSKVAGIDAIMFGHAHSNFPGKNYSELAQYGIDNNKGTINGVAAVMPGFWGNNLGLIDLNLEYNNNQWQVTDSQSKLKPIYIKDENNALISMTVSDGDVEAVVESIHQETRTWVNAPFAKIAGPINSYFALVNDDPSIEVVTAAQSWYTQKIIAGTELDGLPVLSAGAPFRAGRGGSDDYTSIAVGDIAYRNVADLYIYPNILKVLKLSGREVKNWLEMSAGQFNTIIANTEAEQALINPDFPSYNFDVIDGVNYQIDLTQAARFDKNGQTVNQSDRIVNLTYKGLAITDEQEFLVATNNYRASGGGHFPDITPDKIVIDSPNENRQVVADYLILQSELNPEQGLDPKADNNWSFSPIAQVNVIFSTSTSEEATLYAQDLPHITPTEKITDDGFAIYRINLD